MQAEMKSASQTWAGFYQRNGVSHKCPDSLSLHMVLFKTISSYMHKLLNDVQKVTFTYRSIWRNKHYTQICSSREKTHFSTKVPIDNFILGIRVQIYSPITWKAAYELKSRSQIESLSLILTLTT